MVDLPMLKSFQIFTSSKESVSKIIRIMPKLIASLTPSRVASASITSGESTSSYQTAYALNTVWSLYGGGFYGCGVQALLLP
jgi:hypothetical protein